MLARMLTLDRLESSFFEPLLGETFRLVAEARPPLSRQPQVFIETVSHIV
jgi:hypothetical protein